MDYADTKFDILVTEICDKITICMNLLQKENIIDSRLSLREAYNNYLHPSVLNTEDEKIWDALGKGEVLDVFQFSTGVGLDTAKRIKPKNPAQLTSANCLMRLMGEKGKERPIDRYCRLKDDMSLWYKEVRGKGLSEKEIKVLEPYYLPNYGTPTAQEDLMLVCMDGNIAHFTLKEANMARKVVSKKDVKKVPELKKKFLSQCPNENLGNYVWETVMEPQMSYAFAKPHGYAYSYIGIQTLYLATNFPQVFWNCACLIVKAGGAELLNDKTETTDDDSKKNKNANYGKIAAAIGECLSKNIKVLPPDINKSSLLFSPDNENNSIIYGLKGISGIGDDIIKIIIANRPYSSIEDFLTKIKINKPKMISLLKSGCFDSLYPNTSREEIINTYIDLITEKKKRITLQNMNMLIQKNLIPEKFSHQIKVFNFNKYLKNFPQKDFYLLNEIALKFYLANYDDDLLKDLVINENGRAAKILKKDWETIYDKEMDVIREWFKDNQAEILDKLNQSLRDETAEKYIDGNISKWEMESLSFYYHKHELTDLRTDVYSISDFTKLNREPIPTKTFNKSDGNSFSLYKLSRIAGTIIDKDKDKSTITLLTTTGVVNVKIWKNQYAKWDRQLAEVDCNGKKTVIEKSWFARGTKIIITGIRRGDSFIPKRYKNTNWPLFEKINKMDDNGWILSSDTERIELEEE